MADQGAERRKAQRVLLERPVSAKLGDRTVSLEEIGLVGARGQCSEEIELLSTHPFSFELGGESVSLEGRVARCRLQEQVSEALGELRYDLGIEFLNPSEDQQEQIKDVILSLVTGMLEFHKANARGEHWSDAIQPGEKIRSEGEPELYTSCRLLNSGSWQMSTIMKPVQPRDGFTVRQATPEHEVEKLKESYAGGSEEERHLIRVMAEIASRD